VFALGIRLEVELQRVNDEQTWNAAIDRITDAALQAVLDLRSSLSPDAERAIAEVIQGRPNASDLEIQCVALIEEERRLRESDAGEVLPARYEWALRVARFTPAVAIGAAVAGPLSAIVPWSSMAGEVTKATIGAAAGAVTSEISTELTKSLGRRFGDREARQRSDESSGHRVNPGGGAEGR
jgi:hypothetical protein